MEHEQLTSEMVMVVAPEASQLRYDYTLVDVAHRQSVIDIAKAIRPDAERMARSAMNIGTQLLKAKEMLPYGQFTAWVEVEFGISERMAQNMMNVAREYGDKPETVSGLSDSVMYVLAAPSTPSVVREIVEAKFKQTGEVPSRTEVKRLKAEHTQKTPPPSKVVYSEPEPKPEPKSVTVIIPGVTVRPFGSGWMAEDKRQRIIESWSGPEYESALAWAKWKAGVTEDPAPAEQAVYLQPEEQFTEELERAEYGLVVNPETEDEPEAASDTWSVGAVGLDRDWTEEEFDAYAEAHEVIQQVHPLAGVMPIELACADYRISFNVLAGKWQWVHDKADGPTAYGDLWDSSGEAIEHALQRIAKEAQPAPSASGLPIPQMPTRAGSQTAQERLVNAQALRSTLCAARVAVGKVATITGKHVQILPFLRELDPIVDDLDSLISALSAGGKAGE